jgi:uncharacterized membrane protein
LSNDTLSGPPSKFTPPRQTPWTLTTRRIVTAGVLVGITILMAYVPGVGFIPVPTPAGHATIEHLPAILAGVLEGPIIGMITGFFFGLMSFLNASIPLFKDPLVAFVPRILIGLTAWLAFAGLRRFSLDVAAAAAGLVGAATNTIFVLSFAVWRGLLPLAAVPPIIPQAVVEAIVAAILTTLIVRAYEIVRRRIVRASETKPREKLPY